MEPRILILGLDAPSDKLRAGFAEAAAHPMIKGFAVGRTIFGQPSRRWMQGELSDEALIEEVKRNYLTLIGYWREAAADPRRPSPSPCGAGVFLFLREMNRVFRRNK